MCDTWITLYLTCQICLSQVAYEWFRICKECHTVQSCVIRTYEWNRVCVCVCVSIWTVWHTVQILTYEKSRVYEWHMKSHIWITRYLQCLARRSHRSPDHMCCSLLQSVAVCCSVSVSAQCLARTNESCHTYDWAHHTPQYTYKSCHTWVMSHLWMSLDTHMNE